MSKGFCDEKSILRYNVIELKSFFGESMGESLKNSVGTVGISKQQTFRTNHKNTYIIP